MPHRTQTLRDILLEELHNHLYLKSSYCESRWAPYAAGQTKCQSQVLASERQILGLMPRPTRPSSVSDPATATLASERSVSTTPSDLSRPVSTADGLADARPSNVSEKPTILARYLLDLAMRPSQDPFLDLPEDLDLTSPAFATPAHTRAGLSLASGATSMAGFAGGSSSSKAFNPEADSFVYIEHLLEALAVLGRLGWALDALAQREAVEIFGLVENVIEEVEERTADRRRQATTNLFPTSALFLPPPPSSAANGDDADEAQPTASGGKLDEDSETLRDLFWTLYSKLDAVLQGFKVTSEVASRIGSVSTDARAILCRSRMLT
jgi:exocyst complex component 4